VLAFCAKQNVDAIDPTGYYFPDYSEVPRDKFLSLLASLEQQDDAAVGVAIFSCLRLWIDYDLSHLHFSPPQAHGLLALGSLAS
jgi:hypothetical protein